MCDVLSLSKEPDLDAELDAIHSLCPTLSSFERSFPSFCFALATGIGKTRLMGACIAYLRYEKGIKKGSTAVPFKNVVYEYSLAHALKDERYVKVPAVFTRKDFHPEEYTPEQLDHEKLNDGLRIHEETKSDLEIYARSNGKPIVKPFVLVVARDTDHSKALMEYIKSGDFFNGYYADKVMEINSDQSKSEKDENIQRLLALEKPDNKLQFRLPGE